MLFEQAHIDAIARALTDDGLTGTEIGHLLRVCNMRQGDPGADIPKWKRLQIAFVHWQNAAQNSLAMQEFIRQAMAPAYHIPASGRYEAMRLRLNQALLLVGLQCTAEG